ncbi:MAG: hypothetical protein LIO91_03755 [Bacteroidales bacterium]|nr:hypothetical protein [Bacteroidales bacterium]
MPLHMITPWRDIESRIKTQEQALERVQISVLARVGEECLQIAREEGAYSDRTGNLRSSVGYAIVNHGEVVNLGFVELTKDGKDGAKDGMLFLKQKADDASKDGVALVVTAGMDYAAYVEAKGLNVLTESEKYAPKRAKELMQQIGFKIK